MIEQSSNKEKFKNNNINFYKEYDYLTSDVFNNLDSKKITPTRFFRSPNIKENTSKFSSGKSEIKNRLLGTTERDYQSNFLQRKKNQEYNILQLDERNELDMILSNRPIGNKITPAYLQTLYQRLNTKYKDKVDFNQIFQNSNFSNFNSEFKIYRSAFHRFTYKQRTLLE